MASRETILNLPSKTVLISKNQSLEALNLARKFLDHEYCDQSHQKYISKLIQGAGILSLIVNTYYPLHSDEIVAIWYLKSFPAYLKLKENDLKDRGFSKFVIYHVFNLNYPKNPRQLHPEALGDLYFKSDALYQTYLIIDLITEINIPRAYNAINLKKDEFSLQYLIMRRFKNLHPEIKLLAENYVFKEYESFN